MKILLLNLPSSGARVGFDSIYFPLGIGYIASSLKAAYHDVRVIDLHYERLIGILDSKRLNEIVLQSEYDALCIGGVFFSVETLVNISSISKKHRPGTPVIAGGSLCTILPEEIIANTAVDYLVIGEGEHTIIELLENINEIKTLINVPGIMYRDVDGKIIKTSPRDLETDLNKFLFPDRDILPFKRIYRKSFPIPNPLRYCAFIVTSRGCPFTCTFCKPTFGKKVRIRSIENIIDEIEYLQKNYDIGYIRFADEVMLGGRKSVILQFCEAVLRRKLHFFWQGTINEHLIDFEVLKMMKRANCFSLSIGAESGSKTILEEMKKRNDLEHLRQVVNWCNDLGIIVQFSLISGTFSETEETLNETKEFLFSTNRYYWPVPNEVNLLVPIPGTEIYNTAKEKGLIKKSNFDYMLELQDYSRYSKSMDITGMGALKHTEEIEKVNKLIENDYYDKHPFQNILDRIIFPGPKYNTILSKFRVCDLKSIIQSIAWSFHSVRNGILKSLILNIVFGCDYKKCNQTIPFHVKDRFIDNKHLKETEKKVLDVYQKVNPSTRLIEEDAGLFQNMKGTREDLFFHRLKLPKRLFINAKLLSLGSGTGEYETFYARWGCREITCVEMNEISMNRLHHLFDHFNLNSKLKRTYTESYFDVDLGNEKFDLVIADGTIPHTEDPIGALRKFIRYVSDDGFIVIGTGELSGLIQRNIQRLILFYLAGSNEEKIYEYAMLLFSEHIKRSVEIGKRTEEAVIYDSYINPKIKAPSISDLLNVFSEENIHYYSSYPFLASSFLTSSFREGITHMEEEIMAPLLLPYQIAWLLGDKDDKTFISESFSRQEKQLGVFNNFLSSLSDITSDNSSISRLDDAKQHLYQFMQNGSITLDDNYYQKCVNEFYQDIERLLKGLKEKNIEQLKSIKYNRLFKGTCGVGNIYLVGSKM